MHLGGAVALVTGGASGLGEGVVRMVTAAGGRAAVVDLPDSRGAALAAELGPDRVAFVPADISEPTQVAAAVARVAERFGRIDVCVSCAGISPAHRVVKGDGTLFPLDVFRRTVDVNLIGLFDVVRQVAGMMAANPPGADGERGVIVNVASIAGLEGQIGQSAYSASKGAVIALTLPLARDLAEWGIRVLTVCPGVMDTGMLAGLAPDRRQRLSDVPVFPKRLGTPGDFAHLVRTLVENRLMNGETIRLDAATRLG